MPFLKTRSNSNRSNRSGRSNRSSQSGRSNRSSQSGRSNRSNNNNKAVRYDAASGRWVTYRPSLTNRIRRRTPNHTYQHHGGRRHVVSAAQRRLMNHFDREYLTLGLDTRTHRNIVIPKNKHNSYWTRQGLYGAWTPLNHVQGSRVWHRLRG